MPRVLPAPSLFMELKQREMYLSPPLSLSLFSARGRARARFLHFNGAPYADARTSGDGEKAHRDRAVASPALIDNPANVAA